MSTGNGDADADPDFLALSPSQRDRIDQAFDRGLVIVYGHAVGRSGSGDGESSAGGESERKRRKVGEDAAGSGAEGGGGFIADDESEMGGGGGFMAEDADDDDSMGTPAAHRTSNYTVSPRPGDTSRHQQRQSQQQQQSRDLLPFSQLPNLMRSLDLPWDDDVLAVFQSVASIPSGSAPQGSQDHTSTPGFTTRRDFRAVCAALMEPEENGNGDGKREASGEEDVDMTLEENEEREEGQEEEEEEEDADEYRDSGNEGAMDDSEVSADSAESNYSPSAGGQKKSSKSRRTRIVPIAAAGAANNTDLQASHAPTRRLTRDEKAWISKMWDTMFEGTTDPSGRNWERGPKLLGRDQIKRWAELLGENWSNEEVSALSFFFRPLCFCSRSTA